MESEFIAWLRRHLPPHPRLRLGIGDDAALVQLTGECVATTDLLTDEVDFILAECDPRHVGRKSLAVNLSDLAAMAARPVAAVVSLALPRAGALELAVQLYEGMLPLAEQCDIAIAGGDTNTWSGPLAISVAALGEPTGRGVLTRSGARPGDAILVTGAFGGSILGRHFDFQPRVAEAIGLHEKYELHAGTDVSDGLTLDLSHICEASGCGAEVELDAVPVHEDARRLAADRRDGISPLDHALTDGEDFELILAASPDQAEAMLADTSLPAPMTQIGRFTAPLGIFSIDAAGNRKPLSPKGYRH
ncbi:MAG: thiamine-phosphate kinase [Planctomycetes bacterium]|nr:thiamine-phosphate kinase [Planctomycetota bacterium]